MSYVISCFLPCFCYYFPLRTMRLVVVIVLFCTLHLSLGFNMTRKQIKESAIDKDSYMLMKETVSWECGPAGNSYVLAFTNLMSSAACNHGSKNLIKYACLKHDNCYSCDRGRVYCDVKFFAMLRSAVSLADSGSVCWGLTQVFSATVAAAGSEFYIPSAAECVNELNDQFAV